jgi:hypothetical protein
MVGRHIQRASQTLDRGLIVVNFTLMNMLEGIFPEDAGCHPAGLLPAPEDTTIRPKDKKSNRSDCNSNNQGK